MNWRWKARIQNCVALLPSSTSYRTYYWIQRHFGGLRSVTPVKSFRKVLNACDRLGRIGASTAGGAILEVGTGRHLNAPLALWLLGASQVTTVDLNPYVKEELVRESIRYIRQHVDEIKAMLAGRVQDNRLNELLRITKGTWDVSGLMESCGIEYLAPADASCLDLPSDSFDFHLSFNVLEHIPRESLEAILREGNRILKKTGTFIHRIDYSDHFSHSDESISQINFLQYSTDEWRAIAGNRYMYMNRLRVDDFCELFQEAGHEILLIDSDEDGFVRELLNRGDFKLDEQFVDKSERVLATTGSWVVTRDRRRCHLR